MRRLLTIDRVGPLILLLFAGSIAVRPSVDNDLWWQLASGRWMAEHGTIIAGDPFSHTRAGVVRLQVDWLGQVLFYGAWRVGGLAGVSLLVAVLAAVGVGFVYAACRAATAVRLAVGALVVATSAIFWSDRPQMFTYALSGVTVYVLLRWRAAPSWRGVWVLVPLFALWANLHGGSVYGALLVWGTAMGVVGSAAWSGRAGRAPVRGSGTIVVVAAASTLALLANPSGWGVYVAPFRQLRVNLPAIEEFQPPDFSDAATWPFVVLLVLTLAVLVAGTRARVSDPIDWILVLATGALALRLTRAIALFAVVAAPVLAAGVQLRLDARASGATAAQAPRAGGPPPLVVGGALVLAALFALIGAAARLDAARVDAATSYPVAASAWVAEHRPTARLFNAYTWGGYLAWVAPTVRVGIDSRNDLFEDQLATYLATVRTEGDWRGELEREGIDTVVLPPSAALAEALRTEPGWVVAYEDPHTVVLVAAPPPGAS